MRRGSCTLALTLLSITNYRVILAHAAPIIRPYSAELFKRALDELINAGSSSRLETDTSSADAAPLLNRNDSDVAAHELVARNMVFKAGVEGLGAMARNAGVPDAMAHLVPGAAYVDHPAGRMVDPFAAPETEDLGRPELALGDAVGQAANQLPGETASSLVDGPTITDSTAHATTNAVPNAPDVRAVRLPFVRDLGPNQHSLRGVAASEPSAPAKTPLPPVPPRPRIDFQALLHRRPEPPRSPPRRAPPPRPPQAAPANQPSTSSSRVTAGSSSSAQAPPGPSVSVLSRLRGSARASSSSTSRKGKEILHEPVSSSSRLVPLPDLTLRLGTPGSAGPQATRLRRAREVLNDGLDLELATPSSKRGREE